MSPLTAPGGVVLLALVALANGLWESDHSSASSLVLESKWGISYWFGLIFSRGIYFILGSLILLCMGITGIKSKLEESMERESLSAWNLDKLQSDPQAPTVGTEDFEVANEDSGIKERLIEAELTVLSLQKDLEMARRAQEEMEQKLGFREESYLRSNEVMSLQEITATSSASCFQDSQLIDQMHVENTMIAKNLQRALNDKSLLEEEVEALRRESRIVKSAMKDHQVMTLELEELRQCLRLLKEDNESLKKDKEIATSILADILKSAYVHPLGDKDSKEVIVSIPAQLEGIINRILVRKEMEQKERRTPKRKSFAPSGDDGSGGEDGRLPGWSTDFQRTTSDDSFQWGQVETYPEEQSLTNFIPSSDMISFEERELSAVSSYTEAIEGSLDYLDAEEVCAGVAEIFQHPVTGSVAFQQFLQNNF